MSGENELKPREWWLGYVTENGVVVMNTPPEELSVHFKRVHHVREVAATPPASEIVPEGTKKAVDEFMHAWMTMSPRIAAESQLAYLAPFVQKMRATKNGAPDV